MAFVQDMTKPVYGSWVFGYIDNYQAWMQQGGGSGFSFDFSTGVLDSRISFNRASTATYLDAATGLIKTAAIDVPRFEAQGLLLEDARTNLMTRSEDWSDGGWTKTAATVTLNATTAPDGTNTADALLDDVTNASHWVGRAMTGTGVAATVYTASIWVKRATRRYAIVELNGGGIVANCAVSIDFDSNGALLLANGTPTQYNVQAYPNGWYRVQIAATTVDTTAVSIIVRGSNGPLYSDRTYTGSGAVVVYGWGAQMEIGSYASSYVPATLAATVTRARDDAKMTGTNFSSWYNQAEGTFVVNADSYPGDATYQPYAFIASDITNTNRVMVRSLVGPVFNVGVVSSAGSYAPNIGVPQYGVPYKAAVAYKTGDQQAASNGTVPAGGVIAGVPVNTQLNIGANYGAGGNLNGHLRSLQYYPTRLPNATLQTLTNPTVALSLDFTTGVLDSRITFTRGSIGTFVGSNGLIQTAAVDTPRFGYDPTTLTPLGLLSEWGIANTATWSEDFTNAVWGKTNCTIGADAAVAPDGTTTADSLIDNATSGAHSAAETITPVAGTVYTWSCFLKKANNRYHALSIAGGGIAQNIMVSVDFDGGGALTTLNGSPTSTRCVAYPNGWYRVELSFTPSSTAIVTYYTYALNGNTYGNRIYVGTGIATAYQWGAQMEAATCASSYIKTTSGSVTRSPDLAQMLGTNFTSWFNPVEGTFVVNYNPIMIISSTTLRVFSASDGTTNNNIECFSLLANQWNVIVGGVAQAGADAGDPVALVTNKQASVYKLNDFAASLNGGAVATDTSGTLPVVNKLNIGSRFDGLANLNGHIKSLTYYQTRLPNATLQTLST
jgi:hypothetical protein